MALPGIDPATGEDARQKAGLGDGRGLRYGQRPAEYPSGMGASGGLPGRRPPGSWRRLGDEGSAIAHGLGARPPGVIDTARARGRRPDRTIVMASPAIMR